MTDLPPVTPNPPPPGTFTSGGTAQPYGAVPRQSSSAKPVLLIVGLVVLLVVVVGGWWFYQTYMGISGPQNAANAFLKTNANSGPLDAYATTAPSFRDETPESTWDNTSRRLHLARYYAADWTDRDATGDMATLRGVVKRLDLPDLKASIDLRRIDGTWKVATVAVEDPGAAVDQVATQNPGTVGAPAQTQPLAQQPATQTDPSVGPVMSVPRYGGVPDQGMGSAPSSAPLGRAGPIGTAVASGVVGPTCMGILWPQGFHADRVDCPLYLKTQPGLTEQCFAHAQDGRTANVTVTFLDYDPLTRQSKIDCRIAS